MHRLLSNRLLCWKEPILASYPFLGLLQRRSFSHVILQDDHLTLRLLLSKLYAFCLPASVMFSFAARSNVHSWQLLLVMASAKFCAPLSAILLFQRFNVRSWQLLFLMASAKCCAPMSEVSLCKRFNVCSWLTLLLMTLVECCALMSEMLFNERFNICSWRLFLLMALAKCSAPISKMLFP